MRIEALTFLRFIAAFIVVVFHYGNKTALGRLQFMSAGPEMVTFFFVLSGFVLAVSHWNRGHESTGQFYWARITRIVPIYWVALLGSYLLLPVDLTATTLNVTALQAWFPEYQLTLNPTGWSISVEMFFYAVFPLLLVAAKNGQARWLLGAGILTWALTQGLSVYLQNAAALQAARPLIHLLIHYFPLPHLCSFVLGVAGGALYLQRPADDSRAGQLRASLLATVCLLATVLALEFRDKPEKIFALNISPSASLFAPLHLALVLTVARASGPVARFFARRPFVILGEASYAFYILQYPVLIAYKRFVAPGVDYKLPLDHFGKYVLGLLALSLASVYLFEKPVRRLLLRRGGQKHPRVPAATANG